MNQIQVIVHRQARVLTTGQLAESYGTDNKHINDNFQSNKLRYKEGKHFFELKGNELKAFKASTEISGNLKFAPILYLWTEKGAWLHAKSLNTDAAWEAYELLVDEYYKVIEQPSQNSLELALRAALEHEQSIKEIKSDVDYLKGSMRIDSLQQQEIQQVAKQSIVHALGGIESIAYKEVSKKAFSAFWNEFKQYFKVPRYGDIPKVKYQEALRFINLWRPSTSLQMEIDTCNSQMSFS